MENNENEKKEAEKEENPTPTPTPTNEVQLPPRPPSLPGLTPRIKTGCGKLYLTLNSQPDGPYREVFIWHGKCGGCVTAMAEMIGRLLTFAMSAGLSPDIFIKAGKGIRCPSPIFDGVRGVDVLSCPDAIAKLLEEIKEGEKK